MTLSGTVENDTRTVVDIDDLSVHMGPAAVVRGVSLQLSAGAALSLVGESGAGKSMLARAMIGLLPPGAHASAARMRVCGTDLLTCREDARRASRGRDVALVFQNPLRSLNPTMRIGAQLTEAITAHRPQGRAAARARAVDLLDMVRIPAAASRLAEYPHQLSGGMRQRVVIAIALACSPAVLIADEPTTALDVTTQAQILDLLQELRRNLGMAVVLITHDIRIAAGYTDDIAVMYAGRIVERAPTDLLPENARMPYTSALFSAVPRLDAPPHSRLTAIPGRPPDPHDPPPGCAFAPRCPRATDQCRAEAPTATQGAPGHTWACWHPVESGGQP